MSTPTRGVAWLRESRTPSAIVDLPEWPSAEVMKMLCATRPAYVRADAAGQELAAQGVAIVGAICGEALGGGGRGDQLVGDGSVAALAGGEDEGDQAAPLIHEGMELGGGTATRAAYGVGVSPPFPPAAERCALAQVLSIISSTGGPPAAASSSKAWRQTPAFAQRTQRL